MNRTTEYEQILMVILDDLRVCLEYTPNRENDLLCFMEQYLKASGDMRPSILDNLRACMDGEPYPNPYTAYQHYGEKEIDLLEHLLRCYMEDIPCSADKELVLTNLIFAINDLQDKCCGQLIDNWRKEQLVRLLLLPIAPQSLASLKSMLVHQCLW